jgi:arylsulfatase A
MKVMLFVALLFTLGAPAAAAERPNVVVILCDDLGYGDLACYGHPTIRTPNLDSLAAQGWRLTDCYAASPVCSPSRVGFLTGRTPTRASVYNWIPSGSVMHMPEGEITIADRLGDAGYDTALVGKWHCNGAFNSDEQPQPGDFGFDHWFATQNNAAPSHRDPVNFVRNGEPVGKLEGFSSHIVAGEGIRWLRSREAPSRPFYLQVNFHEPHEPVDSPDGMVARYRAGGAEKRGEALYYANVENMDAAVGTLLAALDDMGVADDTFVFFTSDNGPETLDRYRGAERSHGRATPLRAMKLWLYEGGIRVPGIARFPGRLEPGRVVSTPVGSLDLMPTLCALAGVPAPDDRALDGTDLSPMARGEEPVRAQPLFWHYFNALGEPKLAVREGDWMLLATVTTGNKERHRFHPDQVAAIRASEPNGYELYNLRDDLAQARDLASDEPRRVARMARAMHRIWNGVRAEARPWSEPAGD